jgi:hypothetical protein
MHTIFNDGELIQELNAKRVRCHASAASSADGRRPEAAQVEERNSSKIEMTKELDFSGCASRRAERSDLSGLA